MILRKKAFRQSEIQAYYSASNWLYSVFCYRPDTLGMHFGFWEEGVKNRQEAITAQNLYPAQIVPVKKDMQVLDAGCGVGGALIALARAYSVKGVGITIDPEQVVLSNDNAKRIGVSNLIDFQLQDYYKTTFSTGSFDLVVANESVCYAHPKSRFLAEAFRILRPGGHIVIADGYMARNPKNKHERVLLERFMESFELPNLVTSEEMTLALKKVGFTGVRAISKRNEVRPSVRYFYRLSKILRPFTWLLSAIPSAHIRAIHQNNTAVLLSGEFDRIGLADYAVHVGQKPKRIKKS